MSHKLDLGSVAEHCGKKKRRPTIFQTTWVDLCTGSRGQHYYDETGSGLVCLHIQIQSYIHMCIFSFLQARYETALSFSPKESLYCLGAARGGKAVVQGSLTNTVSLLIENKMVMIFLTMIV